MQKIKVKMNKPVYLGIPILEISKTIMYKFWYNYIKSEYPKNAKICYIDTERFIIHIKTEDIYENIAYDVEKWFETSNITKNRPLPVGLNKKGIGLMKDEFGGKIMTKFVALLHLDQKLIHI